MFDKVIREIIYCSFSPRGKNIRFRNHLLRVAAGAEWDFKLY